LMGRLGVALASTREPERERAIGLTADALDMARRLGDKPTLHFALCCFVCSSWGPDNLEERIAGSEEILSLSTEIGTAGIAELHVSLVAHLEEAGDADGAERAAERYRRRTDGPGGRVTTWVLASRHAMTALVAGRFDEVEKLAIEALQLGEQTG